MIDLHVVDLDAARVDEARYCGVLDDEERARIDRTIIPEIRRRRALGRATLRRLIAQKLAVDPRALAFEYGDVGKPSVRGHRIEFNVSDSGALWVCAVGGGAPLGVDVEVARDNVDIEGVGRRVYVERERAQIEARPEHDRRATFYRLWTLKESYMKAVGLGFHLEPSSFEFTGFSSPKSTPKLVASAQRPRDVGVATSVLVTSPPGTTIALTRMAPGPLEIAPQPLELERF